MPVTMRRPLKAMREEVCKPRLGFKYVASHPVLCLQLRYRFAYTCLRPGAARGESSCFCARIPKKQDFEHADRTIGTGAHHEC